MCPQSDARLKRNIEPLESGLSTLLSLRGVRFEWREPEKHGNRPEPHFGMIAQEVARILPNWVHVGADGYLRLTYPGFEALVVESLRELDSQNKTLRTRASAQETELERIKTENALLQKRLASFEARLATIERHAETVR